MFDTTAGVNDPPIVPRIPEIPIISGSIAAAIIRIAAPGRKGYDAFNDAPSTSPVRLYVRRVIAPPPPNAVR